MKAIYWLVIFGLTSPFLQAQSDLLNQYVEEGLQKNLALAKEQLLLQEQQLKVSEAKGQFYPTISLNASYVLADGGFGVDFPVGTLFNPIYGALNDLSGTNEFPTNLQNQRTQLTPNNFQDTRITVQQPLFNTAIYYNHKAQIELVSVQEAKIRAYENTLRKDIKVAYYNYLKTLEVQTIYDSTRILLSEVKRFNQKLVKNEKATEDIVARIEFELEELSSDVAQINQQQEVAKSFFNTLLHRELSAPIEVDPNLNISVSNPNELPELRIQALARRQELKQIGSAIQANQILTELRKKDYWPTLGLEATGGFQGQSYSFNEEQRIGTVGFAFNWTIFQGKQRKYRLEQTQVQTQQLEKDRAIIQQQIELQLVNAWHQLQAAKQQLNAKRAALNSAEKSYRIIDRLYRNQKALLVEYLDARTQLTNARINVSIATYDLMIRQAELDQAIAL